MTIRERLDADLKEAMKARDQLRMDTIRSIKSAVMYKEVKEEDAAGAPLDEPGIVKVITSLVKQRRESIEQFQTAGRQDLVEKEGRELAILQAYLPQQLSGSELEAIVIAAIQETGATDMKGMGAVMKAVQAKAAGRAEGRTISEMVKKKLSGG
jgi:uncharacterized protein YqeY